MKIQVTKQLYNNKKQKATYKYEPVKWCCEELRRFALIEMCVDFPAVMFRTTENGWSLSYVKIGYCPFCGEEIIFDIVKEENVSSYYAKLLSERNKLTRAIKKTDSKREEKQLKQSLQQVNSLVDALIEIGQYNPDILHRVDEL